MTELEFEKMIQQLDDGLVCAELESTINELDIDVDSILAKTHKKVKHAKNISKRRKITSLIAASVAVILLGTVTVYANEISSFIQSLFGKTAVYSTIVEGTSYYLPEPIKLGENQILKQALFSGNELALVIFTDKTPSPTVEIEIAGGKSGPNGFSKGENGSEFYFYPFAPTSSFNVIVNDISYPVTLTTGASLTQGGNIVEANKNNIDWIQMGAARTKDGVQIMTTLNNPNMELHFLGTPETNSLTYTFEDYGMTTNTHRKPITFITGSDSGGNSYNFGFNVNDVGRPITMFTSDAPSGKPLTVKVPGITISDTNYSDKIKISVPSGNEIISVGEEISLGLQSVILETVERTSSTSVRLVFKNNTAAKGDAVLWYADFKYNKDVKAGNILWENNSCIMDLTIAKDIGQFNLTLENPTFIVNGDWMIELP